MELQILSQSISALQSLKDVIDENKQLKTRLFELQQNFEEYKTNSLNFIKNLQISHNNLLSLKQSELEELLMQNDELQTLVSHYSSLPDSKAVLTTNAKSKLFRIFHNEAIWSCFKSYLNTCDSLKLLKTDSLKPNPIQLDLMQNIENLLSTPAREIPEKDPPQSQEQQDVNLLLEKYVKNQYIIGKSLEKRLNDAMPTLIRLFKSTGNSMPNQKFTSISELIQSVFPFDVLLETLIKSSSAFSKTPGSMSEWLTFLQNLSAGLIAESSQVSLEVVEITKLKNILVEKLRKAKEQLKIVEKENISLKDEVKKLREVKELLVSRLHFTDIQVIEKTTEIQKIVLQNEKMSKNNENLREYIALLQKSEAGKIEYFTQQIKTLKQQVEVLNQQKKELAEAFNDFGNVFSSFSLKLS